MMQITEEQLQVITETASQAAIKAYREHTEQQEKEKHDRRLRNIKMLLRNYRSFVKHCDDVKADIKDLKDLLEIDDLETDEFKIKSIMRSKERTLAMVKYIDQALKVYSQICKTSEDPEDERRYQIIYDLYIAKGKKTAKELSLRHSVHNRTIYKDVDNACKSLSVLLFGVDGVRFK